MGSVEARKSRASTLPIPTGISRGTLNLTLLEGEIRVAAIGRVASYALVGRKNRRRPSLTGSPGVVILTGSSPRQAVLEDSRPFCLRALSLLTLPDKRYNSRSKSPVYS